MAANPTKPFSYKVLITLFRFALILSEKKLEIMMIENKKNVTTSTALLMMLSRKTTNKL